MPRAQVPRREPVFHLETGRGGVAVEIAQQITAVGPEADDDHAVGSDVAGNPGQHDRFRSGRHEGQHIAREHRGIEWLLGQLQFGQIRNEPTRARMVLLRRLDQRGVRVHTDDLVPAGEQLGADPSWAATGVEYSRTAGEHRVDEPGFTRKIGAVGLHLAEPFDVPTGMIGVVFRDPTRRIAHGPTVARR